MQLQPLTVPDGLEKEEMPALFFFKQGFPRLQLKPESVLFFLVMSSLSQFTDVEQTWLQAW